MPTPAIKSKDPVQQKLRDHKRKWNTIYRNFSQKLKGFKDGLNGRGNTKSNIVPSNIKDPLPNEVGGLLSQLAGEFQQLVNDAETIITEQEQYSRNRKKKQPKSPTIPNIVPQPETQPNVVETLSRIGSTDILIVREASNKLTRSLQYISALFSRKEFTKHRVGLLSQTADIYYSLLDLENNVLTLSISSIPNTISKYKKFKYSFGAFSDAFSNVVEMVASKKNNKSINEQSSISNKQQSAGKKSETSLNETSAPSNDLEKIKSDLHTIFNSGFAKNQVSDIFQMFRELEEENDPLMKPLWADRIKNGFNKLLDIVINEIKAEDSAANIHNIEDVSNYIKNKKRAELISDYIIKTSHNKITRFLKKQLMKAVPYNKTAQIRLDIISKIDNIKILIKKIMDVLEKDISVENINKNILKVNQEISALKKYFHILNTFYKEEYFSHKDNTMDDKMMNLVLKRKLRKELSEDLD